MNFNTNTGTVQMDNPHSISQHNHTNNYYQANHPNQAIEDENKQAPPRASHPVIPILSRVAYETYLKSHFVDVPSYSKSHDVCTESEHVSQDRAVHLQFPYSFEISPFEWIPFDWIPREKITVTVTKHGNHPNVTLFPVFNHPNVTKHGKLSIEMNGMGSMECLKDQIVNILMFPRWENMNPDFDCNDPKFADVFEEEGK
eukprot:213328_1